MAVHVGVSEEMVPRLAMQPQHRGDVSDVQLFMGDIEFTTICGFVAGRRG